MTLRFLFVYTLQCRVYTLHSLLQAEKYDTYIKVSAFVVWMRKIILENGGMDACGYVLENSFISENDDGFQDGETNLLNTLKI